MLIVAGGCGYSEHLAERAVAFYNKRGTYAQWIKEC